jgi:hypothetical protein
MIGSVICNVIEMRLLNEIGPPCCNQRQRELRLNSGDGGDGGDDCESILFPAADL